MPLAALPCDGNSHELQVRNLLRAAAVFWMEPLHPRTTMVADQPPAAIHGQVIPPVALERWLVEQRFLLHQVLHVVQDLRCPEHGVLELQLIIHHASNRHHELRRWGLARSVPRPVGRRLLHSLQRRRSRRARTPRCCCRFGNSLESGSRSF